MSDEEYQQVRSTFPWSEHVTSIPGRGGLIRVLDNTGTEVPLFTMTKFLVNITAQIAQAQKARTEETQPST